MERIFFFPYIGDRFDLWNKENKIYSFFNEKIHWGYSSFITYNPQKDSRNIMEYDGWIYENLSFDKLFDIVKDVKTIEEVENIKYYVEYDVYFLNDVNDETIVEGNSIEIVDTLITKYGHEIENSFYPIDKSL